MQAVKVRAVGKMREMDVEDGLPDLVPGSGQIVISVNRATVHYPDMLVVTGQYQSIPPLPFTPGTEAAGTVIRTGAGVTRFKEGDRVLIHVDGGAYASQALAEEYQCMPLPSTMSFDDAVSIGLAAQTAWFALEERAAYRAAETVLVSGATGAVGDAAIQIAYALGATVLAGISSPAQAPVVLAKVPCKCIDLSAPDLRKSLRAQVIAATGGTGADIVIDMLGGDFFDAALRALEWQGRLVTVGYASGRVPELKAGHLLVKNIAVSGMQWTDYRERQPWKVARAHTALVALWQRGLLRANVMRTYALGDVEQAFSDIENRRATGRILLSIG
jgi:NADPH2:quinone reductase